MKIYYPLLLIILTLVLGASLLFIAQNPTTVHARGGGSYSSGSPFSTWKAYKKKRANTRQTKAKAYWRKKKGLVQLRHNARRNRNANRQGYSRGGYRQGYERFGYR